MTEKVMRFHIAQLEVMGTAKELEVMKLTPADIRTILVTSLDAGATSLRQMTGFARAYSEAKVLAAMPEVLICTEAAHIIVLMRHWSKMVDPRNDGHMRDLCKIKDERDVGLNPSLIANKTWKFAEKFLSGQGNSDSLISFFELIRPFNYGNTQVADLFWRVSKTQELGYFPVVDGNYWAGLAAANGLPENLLSRGLTAKALVG